ncbi:unnamed protein product, partial [Prorocentrum cordatum]
MVRQMRDDFGIMEFQFYDAFEGYSRPPDPSLDTWQCASRGATVSRGVLRAYTEEIRRLGGRSWLAVQATG